MRLMIDLFRAADGRLEGVVHTPDVGHTEFAGVLDLLRVLEGSTCAPRPTPACPTPGRRRLSAPPLPAPARITGAAAMAPLRADHDIQGSDE